MDRWATWLRDQAYRGIYYAWLATGRASAHSGECRLVEQEDGSFLLSTNRFYDPLRLADADECRAFAQWLAEELCNVSVPTMRAREERAHGTYVHELEDRRSWGSG